MANTTHGSRQFYYRLPFVLRNAMASAYGLHQRHARYAGDFREHLRFFEETQHWPNRKLLEFQSERVTDFVNRAVDGIPYYRSRPEYTKIGGPADLSRLPLLHKADVRQHVEDLCAPDLRSLSPTWGHTSGTSGQSLHFPISASCFRREYACRALHYAWGGVDLVSRMKVAFCSGHPVTHPERRKPPFWVHDWANRWLLFSSYHMAEQNLRAYIEELESFGPAMIGGYPSSIYLLALAYRKHGRGRLKLRAVFTASETLLDLQRRVIEDAFGVRVFNWYGNSEMCANIVECEKGELHLRLEHSGVEILNEKDRPCGPGEPGRLVCTGFGNEAFPLIRYDIGDVVVVSASQTSTCGRGGLLLDKVVGRVEEYIATPDGRIVGRLDHLFKDSGSVIEAQLVQHRREALTIRLVRGPDYAAADEAAILQEARLRLGPEIGIEFEYVPAIPRSPGGKFRFVESHLSRAEILGSLAAGVLR